MSLIYLVSIIGQWAGSIYVPTAITQIALRAGRGRGRRGAHRILRAERCWRSAR